VVVEVIYVQTNDHNFRKTASPGWEGQRKACRMRSRRPPPLRYHAFLLLSEDVRRSDDVDSGKRASDGPGLCIQ
jgi:hypothetical protein